MRRSPPKIRSQQQQHHKAANHSQQHDYCQLPSTSDSNFVAARSNIYETINSSIHVGLPNSSVSQKTRDNRQLNRLVSSSTSKLDDHPAKQQQQDHDQRSLKLNGCQTSDNQLDKLMLDYDDVVEKNDENSSTYYNNSFRRRDQNAPPPPPLTSPTRHNYIAKLATNIPSSDVLQTKMEDTSNQYSEIIQKQQQQQQQDSSNRYGHYQVPSASFATYSKVPSVNDEVNQLIETKRKRTLLLLRAKEAPRASFEQNSSIEEQSPLMDQNGDGDDEERADTCSPTVLSEYENLNLTNHINTNNDNDGIDSAKVNLIDGIEEKKVEEKLIPQTQADQLADIVSPSESQNFNTLSLVSDVLEDFSQDDNSLVQQLSRG